MFDKSSKIIQKAKYETRSLADMSGKSDSVGKISEKLTLGKATYTMHIYIYALLARNKTQYPKVNQLIKLNQTKLKKIITKTSK
jgi:hypothetical protein